MVYFYKKRLQYAGACVIFEKLMINKHTDGSRFWCRKVERWREVCGRTNQMEVKK